MNEFQAALWQIPPKPIESVLKEMARISQQVEAGEELSRPVMTFHLRSGQSVKGRILKLELKKQRPQDAILIVQHVESHDLTYLHPGSVDCLSVHNAAHFVEQLSFGRFEGIPGEPAPRRLELKRRVEVWQQQLSEDLGHPVQLSVDWSTMPTEGQQLNSLVKTIEELLAALKTIAEDPLGQEALGPLETLHILNGEEWKLTRESATLNITTALDQGKSGRPRDMVQALEKIL